MGNTTENRTMPPGELRLGPAGIEFDTDGVSHLFSWPEALRRLGSAGADLALHIDWGEGYLEDKLDWVDLMTFEDEVGVLPHEVFSGGRLSGTLDALVEFETDRIRLYYDESSHAEPGVVELRHAPGTRISLHEIAFKSFGAKTERLARAFWFSGSLAY